MFQEIAGNVSLRLTDMLHTSKHIFYYTLKLLKGFTR
jgi:hypothetical protein